MLTLFFETVSLSTNQELSSWVEWRFSKPQILLSKLQCFRFIVLLVCTTTPLCGHFYTGAMDYISSPHACTASILHTESGTMLPFILSEQWSLLSANLHIYTCFWITNLCSPL